MKIARLLTLVLTLLSVAVLGQKKEEQAVADAVEKLNQAMINGDQIALDQLTAQQLSYAHSSGLVEDKDAFITALVDGTSGFKSIDLTDQTIALSGDVAIVRHKFSAETDSKGQQPGTVKLAVLQVWQKQKGKWLLIARQVTKIS
ncbi:MAG: nuclear transport factor 2 family protein [Bacteroidota bacterium]|nr:nuclear transport factor 2 family protein [Bacteroidota bacterium]